MKPLSVRKIKQTVRDMAPGLLLVRKADNRIMGFWSRIPECLEIDYDIYMVYYKEGKK